MSRVGSSRCRITTIFWWCEPPSRTRMSRSASAPRCWSSRPSRLFSRAVKPNASWCERHTRPRTSTPRSSARPEDLGDLAARLAGEPLVGVALPVGEEDQVARPRGLDPFVQLGEVRRPVDQRPDQVALRPGLLVGVRFVDAGQGVAALLLGEQPVGEGIGLGCGHAPTLPDVARIVARRSRRRSARRAVRPFEVVLDHLREVGHIAVQSVGGPGLSHPTGRVEQPLLGAGCKRHCLQPGRRLGAGRADRAALGGHAC